MSLSQAEVGCHASFSPSSPCLVAQERGEGEARKEEGEEERGEDGRGWVVMGTDMERALCE